MKPYLMTVRLFIIACTLLLLGCGGSGSSGSSNTSSGSSDGPDNVASGFEVSANFIKGPVSGGFCELFQIDASGSLAGSLAVSGTSVDGLVPFADPIEYNGAVLIQCSGGTYRDEVTGFILNAPHTRAVVNLDSDSSFVVTPFTEMAVQLAEAQEDLRKALTEYNSLVAGIFGISGDITQVQPTAAIEDIEEGAEADQYLLALLLISRLDADSAAPVTELVTNLAGDLADGDIDSTNATAISAALAGLTSDSSESELLTELYAALEGALTSVADDPAYIDLTAPEGYTISGLTNPVNLANQNQVSFDVAGAEVGATYFYELYSSADGSTAVLEGTGTVLTPEFTVSGLDLSTAGDGIIELRFYLKDQAQNQGLTIAATANKSSDPLENVVVSGTVTFDRVPGDSSTGALDYDNIRVEPARGVTVEAVNSSGTELSSTTTGENGEYSLGVTENTDVRIRVRAEMIRNATASWNVSVRDNTSNGALYVLQGDLVNSGSQNSVRNLHAESGWDGSGYVGTRSAAPFAILDTVYKVMGKFVAVDPAIDFPTLQIFWSRNNNTARGSIPDGDIGSSFYSGGSFYILGDEGGDTDEYDEHIIAHEWGHYFEDRLSRSDSIGGSHSQNDRLDMRVAFSEGWGNALSAMMLDDPVYFDSIGPGQASGFTIDMENNSHATEGWYSEASVQSILYDFYDDESDGMDMLSLGLSPLYYTLIDPDYLDSNYLNSIFVFLDKLKEKVPGSSGQIDLLALDQDINGTGPDGSGETNDGNIPAVLPLYKTVDVDGVAVELCSTDKAGSFRGNYNSLGGRDFAWLEIVSPRNLEIMISLVPGSDSTPRDPDLVIWNKGEVVSRSDSDDINQEIWNGQLAAGSYVLEVYDWNIVQNDQSASACFELSVSTE